MMLDPEQPDPLPTDPPEPPPEGVAAEVPGWQETAQSEAASAETAAKGYADTQDVTVASNAAADATAKADAAEADAKAYTDQQIPLVAGRMVPRNEDRAPTASDGVDVPAGTGWNEYDPTTGDLVQMWRWDGATWVALDMSAQMIPVLDIGSATVGDLTGGRINVQGGPIVAGTPGGARVEIAGDGLHAYDATGVETARIIGEEGVFVGGEFRTSDALPGQVTISDDAYVTHLDGGGTFPGVKVVPIDTTDMQLPAAIGPSVNGLTIFGGRNTAGGSSIVQANPTASFMRTFSGGTAAGEIQTSPTASLMRTFREDGTTGGLIQTTPTESRMRTYRQDGTNGGEIQTSPTTSMMRTFSGNSLESGWMRAQPQDAELAYVDANNTYFSLIRADASEAFIYTRAGGTTRTLSVDANGVWVKTDKSGSWKQYNLEDNASDSGWQPIAPAPGFTAIPEGFDVRQLGRMIYLRGAVTGNVTTGWVTIGTIPAGFRPTVRQINSGASSTITNMMFQTGTSGELQVKGNNSGTGLNIFVNTILYPVD